MTATRNRSCPRYRPAEVLVVLILGMSVALGVRASETNSAVLLSYTVEHASTAPIVDGVLDDPAWDDLLSERLDWEVGLAITWLQSADFDGSFKATWRDGTLYIGFRFQDDDVRALPSVPADSDQLIIQIDGRNLDEVLSYTVPTYEGSSLEDPGAPFVAWSPDATVCELSIETEAMYSDRREARINIIYADSDTNEQIQHIGWVPQGPGAIEPQLGSFIFANNLNTDAKLVTSWGKMKTLY